MSANYSTRKTTPNGSQGRHFHKGPGPSNNHKSGQAHNNNPRDGCRNNNQRPYKPKSQICEQLGHTTKACPQLHSTNFFANCATASSGSKQKWLLDSAVSHNIIGDLQNLTIHSKYDGTKEVVLGNGSGLAISHVGYFA